MSAEEAAQRGGTPDVRPPGPAAGAATSSDDAPAALEQAGDFVASYLSDIGDGGEAGGLLAVPSEQPVRTGQALPPPPPVPLQQQAQQGAQPMPPTLVPVAPATVARPATGSIGPLQQSLAAGVQQTLAQGIASGAVEPPRLVSIAANGALTYEFGAAEPGPAAPPGGDAQPPCRALRAAQSEPLPGSPGTGAQGGAQQPAGALHGMRGVAEAPPGSGQFKLAVKLLAQVGLVCPASALAPALAAGPPGIGRPGSPLTPPAR